MKLTPPVELVSPPDPAAWDALVDASDSATVFHTSVWARLWIAEWPGARWEAVVLPEGDGYAGALGLIVHDGPLGRRVMAMPYGTYGGPIVRRGHPDPSAVRRMLLEGYAQLVRHAWVMLSELTWYEGLRDELPHDLVAAESFTHVRPLEPDFDKLLSGLPSQIRSRVRQAEENDLTVRPITDARGVRVYHALAVRTVRRLGGLPKPLSLYQRIFRSLVPEGLARYDLVEQRGMPIAASLHFTYRGSAINWLTVSDDRKWDLRPNHLVIARVMRDLCRAGYHEYNLGGSPREAEGLVHFKESWGATRRLVLELRMRSRFYRMLRGEMVPGPAAPA
ncbi:MAG TPA: GNAT family N-acetyltransferase [Candidatus Eisenbacteria bacterium]|nr:GNAT family N-acetyltransferase [Candidatus Eisenbacteria bacterium]